MKVTIFEGTQQEVTQTLQQLNGQAAIMSGAQVAVLHQNDTSESSEVEGDDNENSEVEFVDVEVARRVLNRRPLAQEMLLLLRELYTAYPDNVSSSDLQATTGYSRPQFTGAMGAMGRRFTHTDGFVPGTWFFRQDWDYEAHENRYGLPESVYEAMRLEALVQ
jgi:hypothetical protein